MKQPIPSTPAAPSALIHVLRSFGVGCSLLSASFFGIACDGPYPDPNVGSMKGVLLDPERQILVTQSKSVIGQTEVVKVIDATVSADSQFRAYEDLRRRGRLLGADAVLDARFELLPASSLAHISGVAVRFTSRLPAYEEVARVEVSNPEERNDSGLKDLLRRAAALGADEVVKIELRRANGKDQSKLTGVAVRWLKPSPPQ